jgi:hypothetical protein
MGVFFENGKFLYDINNKDEQTFEYIFSIIILFALQAPISNFHQYFCT